MYKKSVIVGEDLVMKRSSQDVHVDGVVIEQELHDAVCQRTVESTAASGPAVHLSTAHQLSFSLVLQHWWTQGTTY